MVKKTTTRQKKLAGSAAEIDKIEACIHQDYVQLEKVYPKVLAAIEKELADLKKEKAKAKGFAKPAKRGKAAKRTKGSDTTAVDKKIAALTAEKVAVKQRQNKFKAKKKLWQKFEKSWAKQVKKAGKVKRRTTRKTRVATASTSA